MDSTDAAKTVLLRPLARAMKHAAQQANTLREETAARDSEAVQETNFHYNQSTGEQGIDKMLKGRGWELHDSGNAGASYKKDGHSISVQKEGGWSHAQSKKAGKGIATLETHLKHYFDHKRSDVKKEEVEIDELSKDTLKSYKEKAAKDFDKKLKRGGGDIAKRAVGIQRAVDKVKEETEEITELSQDTLIKYKETAAKDFDKKVKRGGGDIAKRAVGIQRAVDRIKEARKQEPELYECLGFDTGDIAELQEFPTNNVKVSGDDPFNANELIVYHNRMIAHHQQLKDLAAGYARETVGDQNAHWNAAVSAHANQVDAHAAFLDSINQSGVCTSGDGDGGVGPHSRGAHGFREELLAIDEKFGKPEDSEDPKFSGKSAKKRARLAVAAAMAAKRQGK